VALTLKLLADSFEQRLPDKDGRITSDSELRPYSKGDMFEANSQEEYDRLIESGAAVDPEKEQQRQTAELQARREALEAEQARIDAQLADLPSSDGDDLSKLSREDLNAHASAAGVDDPESLPNKDAVIAAIRQAEQSQG
jgi:hypothetical protein